MAKKDTPQEQGNEENAVIRKENPEAYPDAPAAAEESISTTLATAPAAPVATTGKHMVAGYDVGDLGTGFEDFTQDDVAVPFIAILQKGSPQVDEDNPKYIKGAKASMFFNTVTGELYNGKEGIVVIPVHRVRSFIEWIPKDDGGGLVNVFAPDAPEVRDAIKRSGRKFGKLSIGDGNDLVETSTVFCLILKADGRTEQVAISFASTQLGGYKKWMTMAQSIQIPGEDGEMKVPPLFSHRYRLTTFFFSKKENTWYKFAAAFADDAAETSRIPEGSALLRKAKEFRAMVMSGAAQVNFAGAERDEEVEAEFEM